MKHTTPRPFLGLMHGRSGTRRFKQRGVSLIEALVAFGVMAFGMMAVVGMQSTLRGSGDLARQRAEAVRIAQDAMETWRGFSTLETTAGRMAFADIVSVGSQPVAGVFNTTYRLRRQVNPDLAVAGTVPARRSTLVVDVGWEDRTGQTQSVRLASSITGMEPELTASLALAANPNPIVAPRGRHRSIPPSAVTPFSMPGRSGFVPPGQLATAQARVAWVFNNATGVMTICSTTGLTTSDLIFSISAPSCGTTLALLLTGLVRYTGANVNATPQSVVDPEGGLGFPDFRVQATQTMTDGTSAIASCYLDLRAIPPEVDIQRSYYCAMSVPASDVRWTGQLTFTTPLDISSTLADVSATRYKVCRYHAEASYTDVTASKLNQNYVFIKAGEGSVPYACPTTTTPRTWAHQPSG